MLLHLQIDSCRQPLAIIAGGFQNGSIFVQFDRVRRRVQLQGCSYRLSKFLAAFGVELAWDTDHKGDRPLGSRALGKGVRPPSQGLARE